MPKYRGITVSVISQWEMKQFPEFPHPDSAQSNSRNAAEGKDGPRVLRPTSASTSSTSPTSASKAHSGSNSEAVVSCYIPSIPGIRFFLKYTIEPPYPTGQLFYFKLFMNGRHISSWGVNPRTDPKGQVVRGLFEPDETWIDSFNGQDIIKQSGIESRPFLFTPLIGGKSAADDGGLIEIRTFRAKGRKRRAPSFEAFRPQEQYGLNLPSAGLLDKPQDTRYYDYILVDPKDEPYATFLFNYRSWEFLQSLQLIPQSCPQELLKPSSSFAFLSTPATVNETEVDDEADQAYAISENEQWPTEEESYHRVTHISQLHDSKLRNIAHGHAKYAGQCNETSRPKCYPSETRKSRTEIPISAFAVPQATLDEWAYDRPLPRLPKANSSFGHSRNSSNSSNTPSVTPSLITWLNRESDNASPEPVIGVAVTVPVLRMPPVPEVSMLDQSSSSSDEWSLEAPSQQTQLMNPLSNPLAISQEAAFIPSSITVRETRQRGSYLDLAQGRVIIEESDSEDNKLEWKAGDTSSSPVKIEKPSGQRRSSPTRRNSRQVESAPQRSFGNRDVTGNRTSFEHTGQKNFAASADKTQNQGGGRQENRRMPRPATHADQMAYYGKSE